MTELLQQMVDGLSSGLVYGILALALSVVFQGTGMLNFAQGEMATLSAYLTLVLLTAGLSFWTAVPLIVVLSAAGGALVERVLVRRVEGAGELPLLTLSVALLLGLNALMTIIWSTNPRTFPSPFGKGLIEFAGLRMTAQQLGSLLTLLAVMAATSLLFNRTSVGLRLRAVAQNPASATVLGQHQGLWLMIGWAVAAGVGAFAAVVAAPVLTLTPGMMTFPLLLALAAGTLGGLSSRVGAVVGGVLIGISNGLAGRYVPGLDGDLAVVAPFLLTAVVVTLRPAGIFGRTRTVRV
ncbi:MULTISPECIES: branched-chain amino acid ABC transporter permease [unclassified Streptomyces]|uniref:branched-chain amino acid ABC transporter permease n=1 Tax=unclassified Streptomyces TaxID=2593676 RepID=UPI002DD87897|nr:MULTISPECIES: branched-chain amino acid ABC transporter permease [unclassified Streptomyces]WSA05037.1 branched-chain amino acid ABC transporter permease [Streptomyces sp. NBC_00841]WSJ91954.1 branched-chain amino acid ABC transporter permease [Streptomyces sp. NBC_01320]WSK01133.1 branched-chain amino acid ABC transporter permease [Streptomyces sp. NBC_01320]